MDQLNFFHFSVWPLKIFEVKEGQYAKKLEFGQTKKISLYQLFKTRICGFMTYVQFLPKNSSNLSMSSEIQGFEAFVRWPRTLESWMTDLKFEVLLGGN